MAAILSARVNLEVGLGLGLVLGEIKSCMSTDAVCSTHLVEDDMITQAPSDICPSPVTSGDMESNIFTNTVCSINMAPVCTQDQLFVGEVLLTMTTILLLEGI